MNSKFWWETNHPNENLVWSSTSEILSESWLKWMKGSGSIGFEEVMHEFCPRKKGFDSLIVQGNPKPWIYIMIFFFSFIARPVGFQLCVQRLEDPWQRKKPETYSSEFFPFITQTIDIYKAVNNETTCWSPIAKINHTPKNAMGNPKVLNSPFWKTFEKKDLKHKFH